jgi:2',3'-cyclic-nucleotide 2'-phosphodiesterase (5'-nucleotidase family)
VLLTQADHFGIHVGRVDLLFDRHSRRLLHRQGACELMDQRLRLDHTVLSRAKPQLEISRAALAEPIGELAETLHVRGYPGEPSEVEELIGAAIMEALRDQGVAVHGVMHGLFDDKRTLRAGPFTVNDIWNILPFENYLVTAELLPDEIKAVMEETFASHERRNLLGFDLVTAGRGLDRRIVSMQLSDGQLLERNKRYRIAFNTFDSRSAGHRFMKLRGLLETPATHCTLHPVQTRDTLIDYFRRHQVVHKIAGPGQLADAA